MKKRIDSFKYALKGIRTVFRTETNMKIHVLIATLVVVCGFIFSISLTEWMICLLCFGMVICAEMINTALENMVDLVSPEKNKTAGKVKDIAAGAVLVTSVFAAMAGLIIFVPKGWEVLIGLLK